MNQHTHTVSIARTLTAALVLCTLAACGNDETGVATAKLFYKHIEAGDVKEAAALKSSADSYLQLGISHESFLAMFAKGVRDCGGFGDLSFKPTTIGLKRVLEVEMTFKSTRNECGSGTLAYEVLKENGKYVLLNVPETKNAVAPARSPASRPLPELKYDNPQTTGPFTKPLKMN